MKAQPQIALVNESNKQFSTVVTHPPFSNQHSPNSYLVNFVMRLTLLYQKFLNFMA